MAIHKLHPTIVHESRDEQTLLVKLAHAVSHYDPHEHAMNHYDLQIDVIGDARKPTTQYRGAIRLKRGWLASFGNAGESKKWAWEWTAGRLALDGPIDPGKVIRWANVRPGEEAFVLIIEGQKTSGDGPSILIVPNGQELDGEELVDLEVSAVVPHD